MAADRASPLSAGTPAAGSRSLSSIRVRAAIAGGLTLGVVAGVTAASWTDAELVRGTFTASSFDLQSSLAGGAYTSATPVSATVTGIYPGSSGVVYAQLLVKTTATSVAGTARLSAAANAAAGITQSIRYRIVQTTATCAASAFTGSPTYAVGGASAYQQLSAALAPTTALAVTAAGATAIGYCIEFSLPATGVSQTFAGTSAVATFSLIGTST